MTECLVAVGQVEAKATRQPIQLHFYSSRDRVSNLLPGFVAKSSRQIQAVSEEQLSALLAKLKLDPALKQKLQNADNIDAALEVARSSGFDVQAEDWLRYQGQTSLDLRDAELESIAGGDSAKCITPSAASCNVVGNAQCVDANTLKGWTPNC